MVPPETLRAHQIEKRGEFAHESGQAAGIVEMLHVMRAGGLEIEQHRDSRPSRSKVSRSSFHARRGRPWLSGESTHWSIRRSPASTIIALRTEASVIRSLGFGAPEDAISAARLPLASAMRRRSAWVAGAVALMGSCQAQRLDDAGHGARRSHHPQVPTVGTRRPLINSISASSIVPARCCAHSRRQSVQAPSTSPL
jgi:hypothetical protein